MTLEQAIRHAEQVADSYKDTAPDCRCAVEHRQLAEWLKELQSIVHCEECKYTDGEPPIADGRSWCVLHGSFMYYCSDGERGGND